MLFEARGSDYQIYSSLHHKYLTGDQKVKKDTDSEMECPTTAQLARESRNCEKRVLRKTHFDKIARLGSDRAHSVERREPTVPIAGARH